DNPLAARVAVNQVWLRHFGTALAPGVFDLGRNAQKPTHPALIDWLAVEFMERGWSLKELHRLILTSAAYRRHSTPDRDSPAGDHAAAGAGAVQQRAVAAAGAADGA